MVQIIGQGLVERETKETRLKTGSRKHRMIEKRLEICKIDALSP